MDKFERAIKKLIKLVRQLNKLVVEIISFVGWLIILTEVLK